MYSNQSHMPKQSADNGSTETAIVLHSAETDMYNLFHESFVPGSNHLQNQCVLANP